MTNEPTGKIPLWCPESPPILTFDQKVAKNAEGTRCSAEYSEGAIRGESSCAFYLFIRAHRT